MAVTLMYALKRSMGKISDVTFHNFSPSFNLFFRRFYSVNPGEGPEMRENAAKLCRDYLRGAWKNVTAKDIVLRRLGGGLSNWLYLISLPTNISPRGCEPSQVLMRVFGQVQSDRVSESQLTESVIFAILSERHLGPKLLGIFPGGRLEEYIPARALKTAELSNPTISQLIAERIANIHMMNVPISKEPKWMWDTIDRWLNIIEEGFNNLEDIKPDHLHLVQKINSFNLRTEVHWLKKYLTKLQSPVVFSHNDTQEGNILLQRKPSNKRHTSSDKLEDMRLVMIDFEYCAYNYRAYDIANHFTEWTYDYTAKEAPFYTSCPKRFPSKEQQLLFIRSYLKTLKEAKEAGIDDENTLFHEVQSFVLAPHFLWGVWSVVNALTSTIRFGYWEYAMDRFDSYFRWKNMLLSNIPTVEQPVKRKLDDMEK